MSVRSITLRLDDEQMERVEKLAKHYDVPPATIARAIVTKSLSRAITIDKSDVAQAAKPLGAGIKHDTSKINIKVVQNKINLGEIRTYIDLAEYAGISYPAARAWANKNDLSIKPPPPKKERVDEVISRVKSREITKSAAADSLDMSLYEFNKLLASNGLTTTRTPITKEQAKRAHQAIEMGMKLKEAAAMLKVTPPAVISALKKYGHR